jgi:hypothetical protein
MTARVQDRSGRRALQRCDSNYLWTSTGLQGDAPADSTAASNRESSRGRPKAACTPQRAVVHSFRDPSAPGRCIAHIPMLSKPRSRRDRERLPCTCSGGSRTSPSGRKRQAFATPRRGERSLIAHDPQDTCPPSSATSANEEPLKRFVRHLASQELPQDVAGIFRPARRQHDTAIAATFLGGAFDEGGKDILGVDYLVGRFSSPTFDLCSPEDQR